ncbi:SDR family NAD(P)-dependent oxidoreductase, partial [Streptomyces sp. 110]
MSSEHHGRHDNVVAVVGVACRLPGADGPTAFWDLLRHGVETVGAASGDRRPADPTVPAQGGFLARIDEFDAGFFGVPPAEAHAMDPQQRLVLELAWEALEEAGIVPASLHSTTTGVYLGVMGDDYARLTLGDPDGPSAYSATGVYRSIIANRVSHFLGVHGPSLTIDAGQSSSLVAVHLAVESLRRGECDTALVGGVSLIADPDSGQLTARMGAMSPDGRCYAFDERANGFVRGEGAGLVVLKRLSAAIADGDRVLCVIRGSAINNDGDGERLTDPSAVAQEALLTSAYQRAGVTVGDVQYVEAHGTGTRVGDPVEAVALGAALARHRPANARLRIGSVKTNIGHLEGAAGIAGLIKTVLCIAHRELVPSLNFERPNPAIAFDELGLGVQRDTSPWPRPQDELIAGVSSFGIGGTNCHVVLGEWTAPAPTAPDRPELGVLPLVVSGATDAALSAQAARLATHLDRPELPAAELAELAHALATTRTAFAHRAVVIAPDRAGLTTGLAAIADNRARRGVVRGTADAAGTAFLFSGQGSQHVRMGLELAAAHEAYARAFAEVERVMDLHLDHPLAEILRDPDLLHETAYSQPALFAVEVALFRLYEGWGITPDLLAGHSIGELAAAHVAGILSLDDACTLVAERGRLMQDLPDGAMLSLRGEEHEVRTFLDESAATDVSIAALNGPVSTTLAGNRDQLTDLAERWRADGGRCQWLEVNRAFHSSHTDRILDEFREVAERLTYARPRIPVVSNVTGRVVTGDEMSSADYWVRHVRQTVRFHDGIRALDEAGVTTFVELGPDTALSAMGRSCLPGRDAVFVSVLQARQPETRSVIAALAEMHVRGVRIDWSAVFGAPPAAHVPLPTYAFQRSRYWLGSAAAPEPDATGAALDRRMAGLAPTERTLVMLDLVREHAAAVLGHDDPGAVAPTLAFHDLGFTSFTGVDLGTRLARAAGVALSPTAVFDFPTPQALAEHLVRLGSGTKKTAGEVVRPRSAGEPIAIVSMACRFPGGVSSPEDLWRLVSEGVDAVGDFPTDRGWDTESAGYARAGGFLSGAADFDAEFFGVSPREAVAMDPQQRLLLEVSWEALERAGLDPAAMKGTDAGVFAGLYSQDYASRLPEDDAGGFRLTGNTSSVASGRVAYTFGLEGPAVTVDTACSSSLVAMHLAAQALRNGECSLALAGGVTVMSTPGMFTEFAVQGGLAADGRVKAFSADADGTNWAEGVGVVVLERLSEARRLGHPVLAVLRGSAVNQDGASNGLTAPNGPSQERVIRRALADARLSASDVDAVEGHGTGTALGDPIEAQALLATYGQGRSEDQRLWLGSVKSNIGHTQAAAGVAGVIKMVEAFRHGVLPATLHADEASPHVDWTAGEVRLLTEARSWESEGRPRRAGVSSFGISGTNAHVILEEASAGPVGASSVPPVVVAGGVVPWVLSARSDAGLRALAGRLASDVPVGTPVADVAGALAASRAGLEFRAVVLGVDREELDAGLTRVEPTGAVARGPVAWVFPGQGSQWVGMGRELAECSPVFAGVLDEVCAVADPLLGRSLREVMFSGAEVHQTGFTQVAVFAFEAGLAAVAQAAGLKPDFVAGHSVGEVTAAYVAGAVSLEDAVRLLVARGALMQGLPSGGAMAAVQAAEHEVDLSGLEDRVAVAAVNGSSAVVLSGDRDAVEEAVGRLAGRKVRWLEVSHAFHSPLMRPIADELARVVTGVQFTEPRIPLVSAVTGAVAGADVLGDPGHWVEQAIGTVRFHDVVRFLHERGIAGFVELGPDTVLSSVVHDGGAQVWAAGLAERDDAGARRLLAGLARAWTHGAAVDWTRLVPEGGPVTLPTYPFQHRRYWAAGRAASGSGHPVLGEGVPLASGAGTVFAGRLVPDPLIDGSMAVAELAVHAAGQAGWPVLEELVFEEALAPEGPVQVQVSVAERRLEVFARPAGAVEWVRYASAVVSEQMRPVSDHVGDEVAVEVADAAGYAIHPALLEAALNLGPDEVPSRWEGVRLHAAGARELRVRSDGSGLLAVDGGGQPVLEIARMTARSAPDGGPGRGDLLGLRWEPVSADGPGMAEWTVIRPGESVPASGGEPVTVAAVCEGEDPLGWVLGVVRQWTGVDRPVGSRLVVVTRQAVAAGPGDTVEGLGQAPVWGLVRAARGEHPGHVLVLADTDTDDLAAVLTGAAAGGELEVAVRRSEVRVPRLRPLPATRLPGWPALDGTVLVTGGTGTLGGLVARHLVDRHGVRDLVLASRSGAGARGAAELVAELEAAGARVRVVAADLAERAAADALVASIPDLAGVVHAAGVLAPEPVQALTADGLVRTLRAKAVSAWHLHEATAHLDLGLFVLFSSLSGLLSTAGFGAYAAANVYLDALAARRRAEGRPGVSIAWSMWEQSSALTEDLPIVYADRLTRGGGVALETEHALSLLDAAVAGQEPVVAAGLDIAVVRAALGAGLPLSPLLHGLGRPPRRAVAAGTGPVGELARRLAETPEAERSRLVLDLVRGHAAAVLGHDDPGSIASTLTFHDLGFTSFTGVEFGNRLTGATGVALSPAAVFDYPTPQLLAEHLVAQVTGAAARDKKVVLERSAGEPIAIVSMACRYPGEVASPEDLWRLVSEGVDAIGDFPTDRGWETESAGYARVGGFLSDAAEFDAEFFGISPREAVAMDPHQRLLLEVSWEALERAGLDPTGLRGSDTGVFAGLSGQDYSSRLSDSDAGGFRLTGNASSVVSGRVAYTFGLEGPAVTVDTACSSSLVAMHLAAQALRNGECSLALAGGVTVLATEGVFAEFAAQGGLASDGRCKPFSAAADGTGWGEGVGVVLLERLSEAQRLGHPVLAVLRGSAVNQDGASNGLSAPNGPSQERVIRRALADARLVPGDVDVVEGHGTGTTLGDPIEARALLATYGQDRPEDRPLWLGSVKSNIGHTQGAAGVAGVIKMVEAMRHGVLPAMLHADEPSPHVDWTAGEVRLLAEERPWESGGRPRRAGVSSFGISGTNAHVIVEEAPAELVSPREDDVAPVVTGGVVPWVLSARSGAGLAALAGRLVSDVPAGTPVADVAVSLAGGRAGLGCRAVVLGVDRVELDGALVRVESGGPLVSGGDVAFVFPGQGSQWLGMGRELLACSPVFAEFVAECERLVDFPLRDALVSGVGLERVEVVQPALFVMMVGLARVWEAAGVAPSAVVGHSQGELAAACFAGALSLEDALGLVIARGRALVALAGTGGMLSVVAAAEVVEGMLADGLVVAAVNAAEQVVVSGAPESLDALAARCEAAGIRARRVDVD